MIKLDSWKIAIVKIDGRIKTFYGRSIFSNKALSPRKHIKHINKVNKLKRTGKKNDPVLTQGPEYIGER